MAFVTDRQTMDDLGIFGKGGGNSVYAVFNRTCTSGGASLLEEMFQYPLSDAALINERASVIVRFSEQKISFPLQADLFGLVEHYLESNDERTKVSHEQRTVASKLIRFIASDAQYKLVQKGVTAIRDILVTLNAFLLSDTVKEVSAYGPERDALLVSLQELLGSVRGQDKSGRLSDEQLAEYDNLFRFKKRQVVRSVLQAIYRLDVFTAVARVADDQGYAFAVAKNDLGADELLHAEGIFHPLLKNAVANDVSVSRRQNLIFLTGANMAGKSTFMKTIGISVYLAHMGFPIAARRAEFVVMDGLYTTINLADNLNAGASHFYSEVLRIKKVARELAMSKRLFVIFDELFRGTNVKDAYEATIAVIRAFSVKRSSMFIISTHIMEAGEVLRKDCENIRFLYLPTRMKGTVPIYTYRLERGITDDRHGMVIIRNEGILQMLTDSIKDREVMELEDSANLKS